MQSSPLVLGANSVGNSRRQSITSQFSPDPPKKLNRIEQYRAFKKLIQIHSKDTLLSAQDQKNHTKNNQTTQGYATDRHFKQLQSLEDSQQQEELQQSQVTRRYFSKSQASFRPETPRTHQMNKIPESVRDMLKSEWKQQKEFVEMNGQYAEKMQRKASKETVNCINMKILNKVLRKERFRSERFQKKIEKQTACIKEQYKAGKVDELGVEALQERETIKILLAEQLSPARNAEGLKRMLEETLRAKQVHNLIDKLKSEKTALSIHRQADQIKLLKEQGIYNSQYFGDKVKDTKCLLKPMIGQFLDHEQPKHQKQLFINSRIPTSVLKKDNFMVDFFEANGNIPRIDRSNSCHQIVNKQQRAVSLAETASHVEQCPPQNHRSLLTKKKSMLTGGFEINYTDKYGFKVRLQQAPPHFALKRVLNDGDNGLFRNQEMSQKKKFNN